MKKSRSVVIGKLLLAGGLSLTAVACRKNTDATVSPQPILAQIGESFPIPPVEKQSATTSVADPAPATQEATNSLLPAEVLPLPPKLSPGVDEVLQLARAQLGDEVLLAYIENSPARFNLRTEDILYLHDLGLSAQVIAAMIRHDQTLPVPDWQTPSMPAAQEAVPSADKESGAEEPATAVAVTTAPAPAEQANITQNYFYTTLSPYGSWIELPDYGWCWRPTVAVVDPGWRPYAHNGRWIYSDYGWYWHSYYSWGWAPFHYGRWHLSGPYGWVWLPDRHWGPAWVTWRYYDGYYGWAPLPPGAVYSTGIGMTYYGSRVSFSFGFGFGASYYTFVPVRHFYSHRPWQHCVPHGHVGPIYNNSTVINNYVQGNGNNTVINVGPGTGAVTAATRTEIPKVRIRDIGSGEPTLVRAESLSRDGTTLNVYRPRLPEQAATPPLEVTRRQQEMQARTTRVSNSEAAQAAVVKARSVDRSVAPNLAAAPGTANGPSASPRAVRGAPTVNPSRSVGPREPAARSGVNAGTRFEPQRAPNGVPNTGATRVEPKPAETVSPQRTVSPQTAPQRRSVQPAAPRAEPRVEPSRSAQPERAPAAPAARTEPSRTVNPAYSVTPTPPTRLTPQPSTTVPSPATRVAPSRMGPTAQPMQPSVSPASPRSVAPRAAPAPARTAPSSTYGAPAPRSVPAPAVVGSQPSGAMRSAPAPSPSPSRAPAAPSAAPRTGGTRNR